MFKFTSTNVINKNVDLTTGKPLFSESSKSFNVKRVCDFKAENIAAIYHSPYVAPRFAKATLDLSKLEENPVTGEKMKKGDHCRLSIYIRLDQSSQSSYYSNDMVFKGKPLSIEFVWQDDEATPGVKTAPYLANIIKKYEVAVYEKPIVKVHAKDTTLHIHATDQYQRFHSVELEVYDSEKYSGMGEYVPGIKAVPAKVWVEAENPEESKYEDVTTETNPDYVEGCVIEQGFEGFGTYEWLLHNLRLPTPARRRAFAQNQDESPIPGAHYDEYVIKYCVNRGILGNNAVGDLVTSMTTHVFYVNHDVLKAFKSAIDALELPDGVEVEDIVSNYIKLGGISELPEKVKENQDEFDTEVGED